jgi:hypothetical protein
VHPRILALLAGPGGGRLAAIEEATRRRFFLVAAEGHAHTDHLEVLAEGKLADLQPVLPVAEGATLELKLVELGLHDPTAGVGKVDGIDVTVAGAAKLVGKRATVVVGRVLDGQAFATLAESGDAGDGPITFESEAEKPTRAPARRRAASTATAVADIDTAPPSEVNVDEYEDVDETGAEGPETEEPGEGVADGDVLPKKRTRRGSRGGRRRRKPVGVGVEEAIGGEGGDADDAAVAEARGEPVEGGSRDGDVAMDEERAAPKPARGRRSPRIHVPDGPSGGNGGDTPAIAATVVEDVVTRGGTAADGVVGDVAETDGTDGATPPKKRTRRGTRGGRNRRKKPAGAVVNGIGGDADAAANEDRDMPLESAGELESDPATSPGLEGRTETPATVALDKAPSATAAEEVRDDGYVPMSEWLEDFSR